MDGNTVAMAEQIKQPTRTTSIVIPEDVDEAIKRFQHDDMRPTWNNAALALIVAGLEASRRRKPLRPLAVVSEPGAAS